MDSGLAPLLEELQTVEENSLYTAQAHFAIAARKGTVVRIVYVGSSMLAAVAGALVVAGLPAWLGVLAAIGGVTGAISAALGADKDVHTHRVAANALTKLRHEARALRQTFSAGLPKDELAREVRRITDGYNNLIQGLPPTDEKALRSARQTIQSGRFLPDFKTNAGAPKRAELPSQTIPEDQASEEQG